jgi:hypothetical protein
MLTFVRTLQSSGCTNMKYSVGKNLTAGEANTLFTVPTGYSAVITYLIISNAGGSTASVSAAWHDGETVTFQGAKSVGSGESLQFGGGFGNFLVMTQGDYLTVTPAAGSTFTAIVSFDLERHNPGAVTF